MYSETFYSCSVFHNPHIQSLYPDEVVITDYSVVARVQSSVQASVLVGTQTRHLTPVCLIFLVIKTEAAAVPST